MRRTAFELALLLACFLGGCSTSSTLVKTAQIDRLDLSGASSALLKPLPSLPDRPPIHLVLSEVRCVALIAGSPVELANYVRNTASARLSTSDNLVVVDSATAAAKGGLTLDIVIQTFERGVSDQTEGTDVALIYRAASRRRGLAELKGLISDADTRQSIGSVSATSETEDVLTSVSDRMLTGATSNRYERKSDRVVIDEAVDRLAYAIWQKLIGDAASAPPPKT